MLFHVKCINETKSEDEIIQKDNVFALMIYSNGYMIFEDNLDEEYKLSYEEYQGNFESISEEQYLQMYQMNKRL